MEPSDAIVLALGSPGDPEGSFTTEVLIFGTLSGPICRPIFGHLRIQWTKSPSSGAFVLASAASTHFLKTSIEKQAARDPGNVAKT